MAPTARVLVQHDNMTDTYRVAVKTEFGYEKKAEIARTFVQDNHGDTLLALSCAGLDPTQIHAVAKVIGYRYGENTIATYVKSKMEAEARAAAVEAEKVVLAKMLVGDNPTAVTAFVSVAQPNFVWDEQFTTDGTGATGFPKRGFESTEKATFMVPPGSSPWSRSVKLHELMHARFTPEVMPLFERGSAGEKYSDDVHQIAEDIRLAHKAQELGLLSEDSYFPKLLFERQPQKPRSELEFAILYMASYGQPIEGITDYKNAVQFADLTKTASLTPRGAQILAAWRQETEAVLRERLPAQETFLKLADCVQKALAEISQQEASAPSNGAGKPADGAKGKEVDSNAEPTSKQEQKRRQTQQSKVCNEQIAKATKAASAILRPSLPKKAMNKAAKAAAPKGKGTPSENGAPPLRGFGEAYRPWSPGGIKPPAPTREIAENYSLAVTKDIWGTMETRLAPLQRNFKALVKRVGPAAPDGPTPRHLHRWYADKHVFMRQGLQRGGALLIDISGSMGWAWEDTLKLIEATPAMTIALYSGNEDHGHLTIIAKDGRLVAQEFSPRAFGHGNGNTVDGPALEWLAKQPRPRVWFSDGMIIPGRRARHRLGEHEAIQVARADTNRICRLGSIKRTIDVDEVKAIFQGKRVTQEGSWA